MTVDRQPVRIWYQSFTDIEAQAPYIARLKARLDLLKSPGTTIDVFGINPPDRFFHPVTEFRCADQTIRNALKAKQQGYDAFVIGHFQEPGLRECRGAVDIPVIGLGEANLLGALSLGWRIGLVTIDPVFIPYHQAQIAAHGLSERLAGIAAMKADLTRFMAGFEEMAVRAELRRDFETQAGPLVAAGADVLIPSGGMPMLLFAEMQPFTVSGAMVVEGIATVVKAAETAVALHRITGLSAGRSGMYVLAPDGAIVDYLSPRA
jgi:Asp/Glu/hydantoin racemase